MNGVGFAVVLLAIGSLAGAVVFAISWMSRRTGRRSAETTRAFTRAIASVRAEHDKLDARSPLHIEQRRRRGD
jgi:hypothetical protein